LWWTRAAQSLSRAGLLSLALTAIALGSLVTTGTGLSPSARLTAASSIGTTGKLKANGSGAPTVIPGELTHRALGSDHPEAKRIQAGGAPVGLIPAAFAQFDSASSDRPATSSVLVVPDFKPGAFQARAPPA
jgi:hypothetical protein